MGSLRDWKDHKCERLLGDQDDILMFTNTGYLHGKNLT